MCGGRISKTFHHRLFWRHEDKRTAKLTFWTHPLRTYPVPGLLPPWPVRRSPYQSDVQLLRSEH